VTVIKAGNTVEVAAAAVGINPVTYYRWMNRGEAAGSGHYRAFWDPVTQARREAEVELVARITMTARNGSWRAAAWLLEYHHPERRGRRSADPRGPAPAEPEEDPFAELDNVSPLRPRDR
jgi:hypothetical protein